MPIQQKLPPPVLLFSDFAGWEMSENQQQELGDNLSNLRLF